MNPWAGKRRRDEGNGAGATGADGGFEVTSSHTKKNAGGRGYGAGS